VGVGTLASLALYEDLLCRDFQSFDIESAVRAWPSVEAHRSRIRELFDSEALCNRANEETLAKYVCGDALRHQLNSLRDKWRDLRKKLEAQLIPFREARRMLSAAGCPSDPAQIGISRARLRLCYEQCCYMRRRFNVLDFAQRMGVLNSALANLFAPQGIWGEGEMPG
jgi:glycerol-1-phosphate dehydrogenase [NAD(P)+]